MQFFKKPSMLRISSFFLLLVLISYANLSISSQEGRHIGKKVSIIEFYGLQSRKASDLYQVITTRYKKPLSKRAHTEDIKRLFATGYFAQISMQVKLLKNDTVAVRYNVKEFPRIKKIKYIGLEDFSQQDFIASVELTDNDYFSLHKVKKTARILKEKLLEKGFPYSTVWYEITKVDPKTNTLKVYFIIDEGSKIPISKINILGARYLNPEKVVSAMQQKEKGLFGSSPFDKEKFESDKFNILKYAKTKGLLDAQINSAKTSYEIKWKNPKNLKKGRVAVLTYTIQEGKISHFGGYSLDHIPENINQELNPLERVGREKKLLPIYKPETLLSFLQFSNLKLGKVFNEGVYFRDRAKMQEAYASLGYLFTQIEPSILRFQLNQETLKRYEKCLKISNPRNKENKKCKKDAKKLPIKRLRKLLQKKKKLNNKSFRHIYFRVRENNLAYIENIIIRGNTKTKEHVIRQNILIKEGQLFNSSLVNLSREKLINLGFFKEVNLQIRPGSSQSKMNLIFIVEEQPTGKISVGGGFSQQAGFAITVELAENNLRGTGQRISGTVEYGRRHSRIGINWREPWIYESCQSNTGSFWKNKQKAFDEATDKETIRIIAQTLGKENQKIINLILSYTDSASDESRIEVMDALKVRIRIILSKYVKKEEKCFLDYPSPLSLSLGIFLSSLRYNANSVAPSGQSAPELVEATQNRFGFSVGIEHALSYRWLHYHSYIPSFFSFGQPDALARSSFFVSEQLGIQFSSSLRNGLLYSSVNNNFNPTRGFRQLFEIELTGSILGGQEHFLRYTISGSLYWTWFDLSFWGLIPNKILKRWKFVQEVTYRTVFTNKIASVYNRQDENINPYIDASNKLYLGGPGSRSYGRLRGYTAVNEAAYPAYWRLGGDHMFLYGTELRIPLEPRFLWGVIFLDAGALFIETNNLTNQEREVVNRYDPANYCVSNANIRAHYSSCAEWNDPNRATLRAGNFIPSRFLYSWGFGIRIQIPILPIRIYYAQKLYADGARLRPIPGQEKFQVVFGIGDFRF